MKKKVWTIKTGYGAGIMAGMIDPDKKIPVEANANDGRYYYDIKFTDGHIGTASVLPENVFLTKEDAVTEYNRRESMAHTSLAETINSVDDLIKMMYNEMYGEEHTEHIAMNVAREKAKELLGVEITENGNLMEKKYMLFAMNDKDGLGFINAEGHVTGMGLANGALFTDKTSKALGIDNVESSQYIQIFMPDQMLDELPFPIEDTAPDVENSVRHENAWAFVKNNPNADFIVMTSYGWYDEKYNSTTNTSRPKIRSFDMDYSNLYNKEILDKMGTSDILEGYDTIAVPITKEQQNQLSQFEQFSVDANPYGFFFEPIGASQVIEPQDNLMSLDEALDRLDEQVRQDELPFEI